MPSSAAAQALNNGQAVPTFNSAGSVRTLSPGDFAQSQGYDLDDFGMSDNLWANLGDFFGSGKSEAWNKYNNYLVSNERDYELAKINDARAWEAWLNSNKYQMAVSDLKKAGLNPWLAVQSGLSGSLSSSGVSNNASTSSSSASKLMKNKDKDKIESNVSKLMSTALKVALMAAIFA